MADTAYPGTPMSVPADAPAYHGTHGKEYTPAEIEAARQQLIRPPLVLHDRSLHWISDTVCGIVEERTPKWWWLAFLICGSIMLLVPITVTYLIATGVGVWGNNAPVAWAWDITNFVFWIGIGHAGTLISAILFLTRQKWRTSINRAAEAMTLFAVVCAGLYPAVHVGRVWMVWFLAPVPTANAIWPNFRSPLLWDVFAVSTYFTVSVLFWYVGLIPDLALLRDRARNKIRKFCYGLFALGWRGGNRQWSNYEMAYLILAGISTPLVLSVHSVVSFDFATSVIPGWHTTIFPPYFVAGAIFGGFAMVLTIMIPLREMYPAIKDLITVKHIDVMCKIILLTGSIVGYAYLMELFIAWYGANPAERYAFWNRAFGPSWMFYWAMMTCNVIVPQFFWSKYFRTHILWVWILVQFPNAGMWFERYVIIATTLERDYIPSAWGHFYASTTDKLMFLGTFGLFTTLFLLFIRFLPMIAVAEVKNVTPQADPHWHPPRKDDPEDIEQMRVESEVHRGDYNP